MNASDWWTEFQEAVAWAGEEYRSLGGFVGNTFTAKAEPVIARLGAIRAYAAINQGRRISSGADVVKQGRNLGLSSLRTGHPSEAM